MNVGRAIRGTRAPHETEAHDRAWTVVRAAHADRAVVARRRRGWALSVPIACVLAGTLALTPAGAVIGHWIERTLGIRTAVTRIVSLPAPGRLLVSGPGGTWTITADGLRRRIGAWRQAAWSPHGLYVAVVGDNVLGAVTPDGVARWMLSRPGVSDPEWYAPTGYRIAYLSRGVLRAVAGDGTGDHLVAANVAPVGPAWRPGHPYQLAYLTRNGALIVRDADSGARLWSAHPPRGAFAVSWSADGRTLVVLAPRGVRVYDGTGRSFEIVSSAAANAGDPFTGGALSPSGGQLVLVRGGAGGSLTLTDLRHGGHAGRRLLDGAGLGQVQWSPDGGQLLVSWPTADQWIFIRIEGGPHIAAISHIAQQFADTAMTGLPRLEGWCCTVAGTS